MSRATRAAYTWGWTVIQTTSAVTDMLILGLALGSIVAVPVMVGVLLNILPAYVFGALAAAALGFAATTGARESRARFDAGRMTARPFEQTADHAETQDDPPTVDTTLIVLYVSSVFGVATVGGSALVGESVALAALFATAYPVIDYKLATGRVGISPGSTLGLLLGRVVGVRHSVKEAFDEFLTGEGRVLDRLIRRRPS